MIKSTKIYVAIYLGIYFFVLLIQAFITFLALCNGELYMCVYKHSTAITTIQTLSYVLAPLIVILGLSTWRKQHTVSVNHDLLKLALQSLENLIVHYEYTYDVYISYRKALVQTYPTILEISEIAKPFTEVQKLLQNKRWEYVDEITRFKSKIPIIQLFVKDNNINEMMKKDKEFYQIIDEILNTVRNNNAVLYKEKSQNLAAKHEELYKEYSILRNNIIKNLYIE